VSIIHTSDVACNGSLKAGAWTTEGYPAALWPWAVLFSLISHNSPYHCDGLADRVAWMCLDDLSSFDDYSSVTKYREAVTVDGDLNI
jgi:hypothetical protein